MTPDYVTRQEFDARTAVLAGLDKGELPATRLYQLEYESKERKWLTRCILGICLTLLIERVANHVAPPPTPSTPSKQGP